MGWLQVCLVVYGILNIGLGIHGYSSGSAVSLIAGGGAGVLALVAAWLAKEHSKLAYGGAAVVCLLVFGGMLPRLIKSFTIYPGLVVEAASAIMLILLLAGHFAKKS